MSIAESLARPPLRRTAAAGPGVTPSPRTAGCARESHQTRPVCRKQPSSATTPGPVAPSRPHGRLHALRERAKPKSAPRGGERLRGAHLVLLGYEVLFELEPLFGVPPLRVLELEGGVDSTATQRGLALVRRN